MNIILRILPFFIGIVTTYLFAKGVIDLNKSQKFASTIGFTFCLGYLFVRYNIEMMKRDGELTGGKVLRPNKYGYVALITGALVIGYGFSEGLMPVLIAGFALMWFADSLLTKTIYSPIDAFRAFQKTPEYKKTISLSNVLGIAFNEITQKDLNLSEIKDLNVNIQPEMSDAQKYIVVVSNRSHTFYKDITINLNEILAWAESFGIDTTHMPSDAQYSGNCVIKIQELAPKQTARFSVQGYGAHEKYDGAKIRYAKVTLPDSLSKQSTLPNWCEVVVDLPGARKE